MNEKFHKVVFLCVCVLFSYRALGTVDLELNRVAQASLLTDCSPAVSASPVLQGMRHHVWPQAAAFTLVRCLLLISAVFHFFFPSGKKTADRIS